MREVKLLGGFPSPFSYRVEWALLYKGIEYEFIEEINLREKSTLLLNSNPVYKKIPVFLHGGKPIAESLIILESIDQTWKENSLFPQNPFERAKARFWAKFIEEKVTSGIRTALGSYGEELKKAVGETQQALETLEEEIKGKEFFGGERVGFVDFVLGWIPHWVPVFEKASDFLLLDADAFSSLHAWGERFLNIPCIKEKLRPSDRMLAIFTKVRNERVPNKCYICV